MVADIGHFALSLSRPRQCDSATKRCKCDSATKHTIVRRNAAHDIVRQNSLSHCVAFCRTVVCSVLSHYRAFYRNVAMAGAGGDSDSARCPISATIRLSLLHTNHNVY